MPIAEPWIGAGRVVRLRTALSCPSAVWTRPATRERRILALSDVKNLRRAGVGGARQRVAEALNRKGLKISARGTRSTVWGPYEVYERVKQYENGLAGRFGNRRQVRAWGEARINKWVLLFQTSPDKTQALK